MFALPHPLELAPFFFFFNDTATTEIYTLSLHDALPILLARRGTGRTGSITLFQGLTSVGAAAHQSFPTIFPRDRKSTRLNSSHLVISYAVFCLKKKKAPTSIHALTLDKHHGRPSVALTN